MDMGAKEEMDGRLQGERMERELWEKKLQESVGEEKKMVQKKFDK